MSAAHLIQQAEADGVAFRIVAPEGLKLIGEPEKVQRWLPLLRPQKPAILNALLAHERARVMRAMVEWNERAAMMTNATTPPEQAELLAWKDLNLDGVFFGLKRVN